MQFRAIHPIDRALSGASVPGQNRPGSNGNEGVLRIPPNSSIIGTSPSDCLVSYAGDSDQHSTSLTPQPFLYNQALTTFQLHLNPAAVPAQPH